MRDWPSPMVTYLQSRAPVRGHALIWFTAKNRTTGLPEETGLWTGEEVRDFTIDAVTRTYYGAGNIIDLEPLVVSAGLAVQMQTLAITQVSPEVVNLIRGYDTRLAPCEMHLALFNPETEALIGTTRVWKGFVDKISLPTAKMNENASINMTLASAARGLTVGLASKRSDATLRARSPSDAFRQYADIAGKVEVYWGKTKKKPKTANPLLPTKPPTLGGILGK